MCAWGDQYPELSIHFDLEADTIKIAGLEQTKDKIFRITDEGYDEAESLIIQHAPKAYKVSAAIFLNNQYNHAKLMKQTKSEKQP